VLRSPLGRRFGGVCELRFVGRVSGRDIALPVQCAQEGTQLVVYVGHAAGKRWWRNFVDGHDVQVRHAGIIHAGRGRVVDSENRDRACAEQVYHRRFGKVEIAPTDPMVVIDLAAMRSQRGVA
jgi:hypothetical protein